MGSQGHKLKWADSRGVSKVLGAVLILAITLLLLGMTAAMATGIFTETKESAAYHGVSAFEFRFSEAEGDTMTIAPEGLSGTEGTTFELQINGYKVWEWNGTERLTITCVYPGDRMLIRSKKGDTTYVVTNHTMDKSTKCDRIKPIDEKFEFAFINGEKRRILDEWTFNMKIDPDGPGTDRTYGKSVFKQDIGPIPVTNEWHYIKRYSKPIEGLEPPVWVMVMTDNVHWKDDTNFDSYNWTDEPPGEPGIDSYSIKDNDLVVESAGSEPTNDIYVVFKPGCDKSKVKIVNVDVGYNNSLYVNGKVAVPDAYEYSEYNDDRTEPPVTLDAPAVDCPGP